MLNENQNCLLKTMYIITSNNQLTKFHSKTYLNVYRFNINTIHFFQFLQLTSSIWVKDAAYEAIHLSKVRQDCIKGRDNYEGQQ